MEAGKIIGSLIAKLSLDSSDFNAGMDKAKAKLSIGEAVEKTGTAFAKIGAAATAAAGLTLKSAIDFEDAFIGVRKTVDAPPGSNANAFFDSLRQDMFDMAREVPSSLEAIAGVYEIGGQLGIESENLTGFSRAMIDLSNSTNLTSEAAAVGFAKLANVTGTSQTEFTNLGSAVVALGNNLATSESEILDITQNIALAGTQAGISAPELMGWGGAMKSLGLESASAGTAFSRFTNQVIMDVAEGGKNLDILAKTSGLISEEFTKAFKDDASGALQTFLSGLGQLGSDEQLAVFDSLGIAQMREIETLGALANNTDLVTKALGLSTSAYEENIALSKEAALRYGDRKSQLGMLWNDFNAVAIIVGEALLPAFRDLMAWLRPIVQRFGEWAKANPKLIAGLIRAGMVIGGLGVAMLGVLKVISVVKTIQSVFAAFAGIGKIGAIFAKIGPAIAGAGKAILGFAATAGKAIAGLIVGMGPIGWIIGAIVLVLGGLFLAWKNNWFGMRDILNNFWNNTLKPFFESVGEFFGKIGAWLSEVWSAIAGFFSGIGAALKSAWEAVVGAFNIVGAALKEAWGVITGFFSGIGAAIAGVFKSIGEFFGGIWNSIAGAFAGAGEAISSALQPVIDWFLNAPAKIGEAIGMWWTSVCIAFTQFKDDFLADIENFDLKTAIVNLAVKIGEGVLAWWESVSAKLGEFWESVKSWFGEQNLMQSVKDWAIKIGEGVARWWTDVKSKIDEFLDKIVGAEGFLSGGDKIYTVVADLWQKIADGVGQWWTNVKTKVGEFLESIKTEIGNIDLIEAAGKIIDKLVEGFNAAKDKVVNWFKGVLEGIPLVGGLFKNEAQEQQEFGSETIELTNLVTISPMQPVPQAVIDSYVLFNDTVTTLNTTLTMMNGLLSGEAGFLGIVTSIATYLTDTATTAFTDFETHILEQSIPTYEALSKVLYYGANTVYTAYGQVLGELESIYKVLGDIVSQLRGSFKDALWASLTPMGAFEGAAQDVANACANIASWAREAADEIRDLINAMSVLDGIDLPGSGIKPKPKPKPYEAARAGGGPVRGRLPYLVGEKGPELFTPRRSGWIIPNDEAFGRGVGAETIVNYNIDVHDNYGDASIDQAIERKVKSVIEEAQMLYV